MKKGFIKIGIISLTALPLGLGVLTFFNGASQINRSKASTYSYTLNNSLTPSLSSGEGTLVDDKGVTWNYHNASSSTNGHVVLGHQGYMEISSSSAYGYAGLENVTVNYQSSGSPEVWLLGSIDGSSWRECEMLSSGVSSSTANDFRYIRLYNYETNSVTVDILSVTLDYSCVGGDYNDDTDLATTMTLSGFSGNKMTFSRETTYFSTGSNNAIRLTNNDGTATNSNHISRLLFENAYTLGDIRNKAFEFDYYYAAKGGTSYVPAFKLLGATYNLAASSELAAGKGGYVQTNLGNGWYRIAIALSAITGSYSDDQSVCGIQLTDYKIWDTDSTAYVVLDNVRITSGPASATFTVYKDTFTVGTTIDLTTYEVFIGTVHSVTYTSSNTDVITIDSNGIMTPVASGKATISATYVIGYARESITLNLTATVS